MILNCPGCGTQSYFPPGFVACTFASLTFGLNCPVCGDEMKFPIMECFAYMFLYWRN